MTHPQQAPPLPLPSSPPFVPRLAPILPSLCALASPSPLSRLCPSPPTPILSILFTLSERRASPLPSPPSVPQVPPPCSPASSVRLGVGLPLSPPINLAFLLPSLSLRLSLCPLISTLRPIPSSPSVPFHLNPEPSQPLFSVPPSPVPCPLKYQDSFKLCEKQQRFNEQKLLKNKLYAIYKCRIQMRTDKLKTNAHIHHMNEKQN
jgi:hypothetical protein